MVSFPEISAENIINWLWIFIDKIGDIFTNLIKNYVIPNIKTLIPNASDEMVLLILGIIGLILFWLKAESITGLIRTATIILVAILILVLGLMIIGLV